MVGSQGEKNRGRAGSVLVVGAGPFQLGLLRAARELGLEVIAVDKNPEAPGMAVADASYDVDVCDQAGVLEVARQHGVRGVLTAASDVALPAVAYVADHLGLPGPSVADLSRCNDKLLAHAALESAGIPVPRTKLIRTIEEAEAHVGELSWERIVIKPRRGAGGRGVSLCTPSGDIRGAFEKAAKYVAPNEGVLLQECVEGVAVGLEVCFFRGKLVRAFIMDDQFSPGFISPLGHSLPSVLPMTTQQRIVGDAERVALALQLEDGPANFDLRLRGDETVVLEVNPRLGGNSISELVQIACGVDLHRAAVLIALGSDPTEALAPSADRSAAARLLISEHRGRVSFVGPLPRGFQAFCEDGANTRLHVDQQAILGRAICEATSPDEASQRAKAICDRAAEAILVEPQA